MNALKIRKNTLSIIILTAILISAVFTGVVNARYVQPSAVYKTSLSKVRTFAPAVEATAVSYAVEGGALFAGGPQGWTAVSTPENVIVGAVVVDKKYNQTVYIGAANEMAVYRTVNNGQDWLRVPLNTEIIGGATDLAMDSNQRILYVGTDNAGVFRLRDVGSSMIESGHLLLDEPVLDIVADSTGAGLAFVRTAWHLYRADNFGLTWSSVDNLGSTPTALALADTQPTTIYVGTTDRGLLKSTDGRTWATANAGLGLLPGSRLQVDALAIDPAQPSVIYAATSYLYGSTQLHQSPVGVAMTTDGAQNWALLQSNDQAVVTDLLPVTGQTGAVYAVTNQSRTPLALGKATLLSADATTPTTVAAPGNLFDTRMLAWIVAGLAALALLFAIANDLRSRRPVEGKAMVVKPVPNPIR